MNKIFLLILLFVPCLVFGVDKIDINSASLADLDKLTGIGPAYAQRIIDGRPYSSIDELDRVKGIGPATVQKIKDQGLACVNCATASETTTPSLAEAGLPPSLPASVKTANAMPAYPAGVIIKEVLPNPNGADETNEYIKLYNTNNFDVDLSGWILEDKEGTTTSFTIPKDKIILANNFISFYRPETKILLNNEGDSVSLFFPNKQLVDSVNFLKAPLGQTYTKVDNAWEWSGSVATAAISKVLPKIEKSVNNNIVDLDQVENTNNNPWFLFYTALATTMLLALVILFIKFKLNKTNVRT